MKELIYEVLMLEILLSAWTFIQHSIMQRAGKLVILSDFPSKEYEMLCWTKHAWLLHPTENSLLYFNILLVGFHIEELQVTNCRLGVGEDVICRPKWPLIAYVCNLWQRESFTLSVASRSAPCSVRHSTISWYPLAEAVRSGVSPSRLRMLTLQPAWHRALATG